MNWKRSVAILLVGLASLIARDGGIAQPTTPPSTPSTPISISCEGSSSGVGVVPGNKAGFTTISILLVTSCGGDLQFIDPFNPAEPVLTVSTPGFSWQALTFRPETPDLLGCALPIEGTGNSLYAIHFSPLDPATPGTITFLAIGPSGSDCSGIAWDPSDRSVYQTEASDILHFKFAPPTSITTPTSIPAGCGTGPFVTGVGVAGARLFAGCGGASPIVNQLTKSGAVVRSFPAPASSFSGLPDDAGSFSAQFKEALWTLVPNPSGFGTQFRAIFVPTGLAVSQRPGACPAGFPTNLDGTAMDTDGDGLPDCWEARVWPAGTVAPGGPVGANIWPDGLPGIDIDGDGVRDIALCVTTVNGQVECADPNVKDIFVEFDAMVGHTANVTALQQVVTAFANAPAPVGPIRLHIQIDDQNIPTPVTGNTALTPCTPPAGPNDADFDVLKAAWFGTAAERRLADTPPGGGQRSKTLFAKRLVVRYGLSVRNLTRPPNTSSPSGCAEIPGNDFVIALGSFGVGNGTTDTWAGTFMHELGHNLGLFHGGGDRTNCKPNYLSVMSYTRQFPTVITSLSGRPDYS